MPLTLIKELPTINHVRFGLYRCGDCGRETEKRMHNVRSGNTSSCGCLARSRKTSKGGGSNKTETPWKSVATGTYKLPLPAPSFEDVSQSEFQRVSDGRFWVMIQGNNVIGKEPMTYTERKHYAQKAQQQ